MNHWIFQANPDTFDVDSYLRQSSTFVWTVRQRYLADRMLVGDQVFIWRAGGKRRAISGIVALGELTGTPREMEDDPASLKFWRGKRPPRIALRVEGMVLRKCIGLEEIVRRESLINDSTVRNMLILKTGGATRTNFLIEGTEGKRLKSLVERRLSTGPTRKTIEKSVVESKPAGATITYKDFGNAPDDDPYELQLFAARVRRGQPTFRRNLMIAYGSRCVISGHGPEDVLEAVHIEPHAKSGINKTDNGLLMRADLHSLFDAGLIRINPESFKIVVDSSLRGTLYAEFHGKKIRARKDGTQPSTQYLQERWRAGRAFEL